MPRCSVIAPSLEGVRSRSGKKRQREGIALGKRRAVYRGRKKLLPEEQAKQLGGRVQAGKLKAAAART